ncbi:MAG: hypothetical protein KAS32_16155 [Candidatus Peribacteraceae bacterium]|nr:hypothetical protein [Candidatus Peribacteraceae bacterium]
MAKKKDADIPEVDFSETTIEEVPNAEDFIKESIEEKVDESKKLTKAEADFASNLQNSFMAHLKNNHEIDTEFKEKVKIPTDVEAFDTILGGGVSPGLVMFVGNPGSGKTALACKVIASGQKRWPGKFNAVFLDSEDSMTKERLQQLGVNHPPIEPIPMLTVEKIFQIVEGMATYKEQNPELIEVPWVIVWDSIANTMTDAGMLAEDMNQVMGQKARALSHYLPKYIPKMGKYNICLLAVNQLRDKIDLGIFKKAADLKYLADKNIPGGKSVLFNSTQLVYIQPVGDVKGEYGFMGTKVRAKTVKNKLFSPNVELDMIFSFERGFSSFWTNFELLKKVKRIKAGSWCTLVSCPEAGKFRQVQALEFYKTKPEFKEAFDRDVAEVLNEEYIEKYKSTAAEAIDII